MEVLQVLEPLRLACFSDSPKIIGPALGALHKLVGEYISAMSSGSAELSESSYMQVSHAYLKAENSPAGHLDDATVVSQAWFCLQQSKLEQKKMC